VTIGRPQREEAMCRSIHTLHNFEPPTTPDEIEAAALQYVRKISGMTRPSERNRVAFDRAVVAVAEVTRRLLGDLVATTPPRDRELEHRRARARWLRRQAATSGPAAS
jgi:hypothetical protein